MKKILTLGFLFCAFSAFGQKNFDFRYWEDSLIRLRNQVLTAPTEVERYSLNEDFMIVLEHVLQEKNAPKFGWDSVRNFSVLASPDNLFKIFTWQVDKDDYTVENFGFIQVYNEGRKKYVIYPLYDKRSTMDYPKTNIGNSNKWYGAVYYKMIPLKTKTRTYYTLLGWNGKDLFTNEKVIEILYFKSDMSPVFGANVFKKYPEKSYRIIFEYAKDAVLTLKYQRQAFDVNTGRRDSKTHQVIFETEMKDMIIFNNLIPLDDYMGNIPAFTVPEASMNQGFVEDNGKWLFIDKVKGRNPDKDRPAYKIKNRNYYHVNS